MKLRFKADPEMEAWIQDWTNSGRMEWDHNNTEKLKKHGLTPERVESIRRIFIFAGRIVREDLKEKRWEIIGEDSVGQILALIFTVREDRLRPISCRPAHRMERKLWIYVTQGDRNEGE